MGNTIKRNTTKRNKKSKARKKSSLHLNPSADCTDRLLVYGYARFVEIHLINKIIPDTIYNLCFLYFHHSFGNVIFHVSPTSIQLADIDKNKRFECRIHNINGHNNANKKNKLLVNAEGLLFARNLQIPSSILNKMSVYYKAQYSWLKKQRYNVIFKCGGGFGGSVDCLAVILDQEFVINKQIQSFEWYLPNLENKIYGNTLILNEHNSMLLSIGGYECGDYCNKIYNLSLNICDINRRWKWNKKQNFNSKMQMKYKRYNPVCMIKNYLFVVGGYNDANGNLQSVEMFDFRFDDQANVEECDDNNNNEYFNHDIKECNVARNRAGIYYDSQSRNVYLGGGRSKNDYASNKIEYYDIYKNEWYNLSDCNDQHGYYPIVWKKGDCLYITSAHSDKLEMLDLRKGSAWQTVDTYNAPSSIVALLGYGLCGNSSQCPPCRLLKS